MKAKRKTSTDNERKLNLEKLKITKLKNTIAIKGGLGSRAHGCPTMTDY